MDKVLKHYYIRVGGNLRALDLILEEVSREGQKGAGAVIEQVEQWYSRRVEPIEKKLDDQEVKNYLLKVAEAGPMGYLPNSKQTTQMTLNLLREEPADCILRSATNLGVALKHWHFVAKLFEEDEQKLRDAGNLWRLRCFVGESPKSNFHILHVVSMMPRYQYLTINDTQNLVSIILYTDTNIQVSTIPRTEDQWYPNPNINDTLIPVCKYIKLDRWIDR